MMTSLSWLRVGYGYDSKIAYSFLLTTASALLNLGGEEICFGSGTIVSFSRELTDFDEYCASFASDSYVLGEEDASMRTGFLPKQKKQLRTWPRVEGMAVIRVESVIRVTGFGVWTSELIIESNELTSSHKRIYIFATCSS